MEQRTSMPRALDAEGARRGTTPFELGARLEGTAPDPVGRLRAGGAERGLCPHAPASARVRRTRGVRAQRASRNRRWRWSSPCCSALGGP